MQLGSQREFSRIDWLQMMRRRAERIRVRSSQHDRLPFSPVVGVLSDVEQSELSFTWRIPGIRCDVCFTFACCKMR